MDEVSEQETLYDGSLPQDIILFQILTRVPTKSVIRFKCVSKQWNSFPMSDRFKEMHNRNHLKDLHLKDQMMLLFSEGMFYYTIDCESMPNKAPCLRPLPQFQATPPRYMSLLTSYHGLVCLRIETDDYQDDYFIFWNPLTREFKRLSKPSNPDKYMYSGSRYGLYYSSGEDDYKLLVVTKCRDVYIYSLKSDSWRKSNNKSPFENTNCWGPCFCLAENLYFLLYNANPSLIRFDTKAEMFQNIEIPHECDTNTYFPKIATAVHKGSIHLCIKYDIYGPTGFVKSTCIEVWNFNPDDGDIWSKVEAYQLEPNDDIGCMFPNHLMSNGNWIMQDYRGNGRICQVELKKKKYNTQDDKDGHDEYELYDSNINDTPRIYTETFVSPNRYMK